MPKTVVITGCSSGFGKQLALHLARRGDRVYATVEGYSSVRERNAAVEPFDKGVLEAFGMTEFAMLARQND